MTQHQFDEVCYDIDGLELHGLAWGNEGGNIILCLHGWLDNAASFSPLAATLVEQAENHRVIAIDWPGHGYSQHRSRDSYYHFVDYVFDLLRLFEVNQWCNIDIVGHSMGGMIASAFTAAFPEKVNSLTLIDSIGFISAKEGEATSQLRQGMLSRLAAKKKRKSFHADIESAVKARQAVSDLRYQDAELIVKRGLTKQVQGYVWRSDARLRMTSPYRLTLSQAEQFIKDISKPVQLIYGDAGLDMVAQGIKHFGPLFKQIVMHEIKGGHHVHMEQPEDVSTLVFAFIGLHSVNI